MEEGTAPGPYSNTQCVTVNVVMPDLLVTNMTVSNSRAREGDKVTLTATVTNQGNGPASASKTEFLLDNATVLGLVDTPAIQSGQSTTVSINWDTRSVKGTHTIRGTADQTALVGESNETNNSSTLSVTIQGNKVKNGSFEQPRSNGSGPEAWSGSSTNAGTTSWSDGGSDGAKSVSITGNGGSVLLSASPSWTSHPVSVIAGQSLSFSVSVKSTGASSAATAGLVYLGVAGQVLNTITLVTAPVTTAGFNKLEQVITIPQGVAQVRVKLVGFAPTDTATAGTVTFDEVGLFENDGSQFGNWLHAGPKHDEGCFSRSFVAREDTRPPSSAHRVPSSQFSGAFCFLGAWCLGGIDNARENKKPRGTHAGLAAF